jgi:hypothetical protein
MDNSFYQQESDIQQPRSFLASLHIFDSILHWLAGLFQLTEEEQRNAGIYLGDQYFR